MSSPAPSAPPGAVGTVVRQPALLAVSHGTSSPAGQAAVARLVDAVAERRPELHVHGAFVDVQQPDVTATIAGLESGEPAVVVPLLLSAGFHVHVDLAEAVAGAPWGAVCAAALGPDARLADILERRLVQAGLGAGDAVVLIAAGSTDARAVADCRIVADLLAERIGRPVSIGFVSAALPRADDAVRAARAMHPGRRVVAATYLLAPGFFAGLVARCGADVVTAPLLERDAPPPAELVEVVLERYAAAVR